MAYSVNAPSTTAPIIRMSRSWVVTAAHRSVGITYDHETLAKLVDVACDVFQCLYNLFFWRVSQTAYLFKLGNV